MAKVQRANILLTIPDDLVSTYIAKGYNVVDDAGTVLKSAIPTDIKVLQKAYTDNQSTIANLRGEIAKLKQQLASNNTVEKTEKTTKKQKTKN